MRLLSEEPKDRSSNDLNRARRGSDVSDHVKVKSLEPNILSCLFYKMLLVLKALEEKQMNELVHVSPTSLVEDILFSWMCLYR